MMLSVPKSELIVLLVALLFNPLNAGCRQSFMTLCDTFEDFKNYNDTENLSKLMIGSEHGTTNMTAINFMQTLNVAGYHKLTTLMVVRAVNQLDITDAYQCTYHNTPLKHFILYGNVFKILKPYQFPLIPLKEMSLVNNKIEEMKPWALRYYEIENLDLSDNFLEVIERVSLPQTSATKIISVRNNRLTHIEPESFPSSLESLNLDKNKLRYIQDEVLQDLTNLRELTLSHNKFNVFPKISHLKNLVIFDLSHNAIKTLEPGAFKEMNKLKLVDLSYNEIESNKVLQWIITPKIQPDLTISLALNRLRSLDMENVTLIEQKMVLYGNPWDCNFWPELKQKLTGHESECDSKFQSSGNVPFCINYRAGAYPFVSWWDKDIDRFHETVKESEKNAGCLLAPTRNRWLYPVDFGCVA